VWKTNLSNEVITSRNVHALYRPIYSLNECCIHRPYLHEIRRLCIGNCIYLWRHYDVILHRCMSFHACYCVFFYIGKLPSAFSSNLQWRRTVTDERVGNVHSYSLESINVYDARRSDVSIIEILDIDSSLVRGIIYG